MSTDHTWNTFLDCLSSAWNRTSIEFCLSENYSNILSKTTSKNYILIIDLRLSWRVEIRNSPMMTTFITCKMLTLMFYNVLLPILLNRCLITNCLNIFIWKQMGYKLYLYMWYVCMCMCVCVYIYIYISLLIYIY